MKPFSAGNDCSGRCDGFAAVSSGPRIMEQYPAVSFCACRRGFFKILDNLENSIAAHDRIVHEKTERGCVFQDHASRHEVLNALAVPLQQSEPSLLLVRIAKNTDEYNRRVQVTCHVHVI